eukprot:COSAG01_NODE_25638_length_738_cov_8.128326_2_plen_54_part_01
MSDSARAPHRAPDLAGKTCGLDEAELMPLLQLLQLQLQLRGELRGCSRAKAWAR